MQAFIVKFQECANKVLVQLTKGTSGETRKLAAANFHQMVGIPTFEQALSPAYAGLIHKETPKTLEEAYTIVREHYSIYVERERDEETKATTKWNPFATTTKTKKKPSIDDKIEAKFKEIYSKFESLYLTPGSCTQARNFPRASPRPFTGIFYNCSTQGHKYEKCGEPCSICKGAGHSNFACKFRLMPGSTTQHPVTVMMAEQFYAEKMPPLFPQRDFPFK
ncbi:hypothetical protein DSO57_1038502 [Entomophthora muscae]|uniref:Uncharacterized protein n=2 Tax=Entomophthora muscae TaxID=34485 RepID=A0ACC2SYQ4_9FUNG|nr:hypothetical protein DSO57_1028297 [Entomophthora muscae]KAJ9067501.1 hypothetical protein DSO57_1038502 [Entomophthora muscae]